MLPRVNYVNGLALLAISLLISCGESRGNESDHAEVFKDEAGKIFVLIQKRHWQGFWGVNGYIGNRNTGYWATLVGNGPVYENPDFEDNPPSSICRGRIILNQIGKTIEVEMQRVGSDGVIFDKPKAHPANGIYSFDLIQKAPEYLK